VRFLYATDLHGDILKYQQLLQIAIDNKFDLIHIGADILPKSYKMYETQKEFINIYLKCFYEKCHKEGIKVLASFGNDDLYSLKSDFRKYGNLLDEYPYSCIETGILFTAYNYVPDYPFRLKTGCKLDKEGWSCPDSYFGSPLKEDKQGVFKSIKNVKEYFQEKGTIEEDLQFLDGNIVAIHTPPANVFLDVCTDHRHVGSEAVYQWILKKKPLAVLSGHIHENYAMTRKWKSYVNDTLVIQPGQGRNKTHVVSLEILNESITSELIIL